MDNRPPMGSLGRALTKLDPSGSVEVLGTAHPARTIGKAIDAERSVIVTGFDPFGLIVREATPTEMVSAPVSPSHSDQVTGSMIGDFFLKVGALICYLGCAFAVVKTVYALLVAKQVSPLINLSAEASSLERGVMILLEGLVEFSLFAALSVVFIRVLQLK
jgi:hypothetical protein